VNPDALTGGGEYFVLGKLVSRFRYLGSRHYRNHYQRHFDGDPACDRCGRPVFASASQALPAAVATAIKSNATLNVVLDPKGSPNLLLYSLIP